MKNKNVLLLLLLATLWGPSFLFIKVAVVEIPPLTLVAIRLTLAAVFLYGILRASGRSLPRGWDFWQKFLIMGWFANALPFVLFSFGEQYADSGSASILNGTTPIFTALFAHLMIPEEKVDTNRLIGVVVGFLGILMIFYPDAAHLFSGEAFSRGSETIGQIAFLVASLSYGIGIVYSRRKLRGLPPLVGPAAQLICSAGMVLPLATIVDQPWSLRPSAPAALSAIALGLFGTAFAYLVYYKLIDSAGATFISMVTYLLPPFGVILGMVFLAESPDWYAFAGMALILAGVMIVNRNRTKPSGS
jgi:drug/metabolite transporter (DMT)-like permease